MNNITGQKCGHILCKGREVSQGNWSLFAFDPEQPDGAFEFKRYDSNVYLAFICPCGCRGFSEIPLNNQGSMAPGWTWDLNEEAPTLSPSILRSHSCGWHGFLRAGIWESC